MYKIKFIFFSVLFASLTSLGQTTVEIAKSAINSTVSIVALDNISQPLAYGSGFIIDDKLIATNVHVIKGATSAYVLVNGVKKNLTVDGYVAIDKANDLVILKVNDLHGNKLPLSSTLPEIGEKIYAIGNPKGLDGTFSEGIVSGIREIEGKNVLQITAPISPGSSGGPVLNSKGEVVGIAFASFTSGQNLNFAIPVKYLENLMIKLSETQSIAILRNQLKSNVKTQATPNISEGVVIRNLSVPPYNGNVYLDFSIKNNLPYTITNIDILILVYDNTGVVVDYYENTLFPYIFGRDDEGIKPYLAHRVGDSFMINYSKGYRVEGRILNYKILDK